MTSKTIGLWRLLGAVLGAGLLMSATVRAGESAAGDLGIVFLHGKESTQRAKLYATLLDTLQRGGWHVAAPTLAWSRDRIYDADVDASMLEVDREVASLRAQGAKRVVLIGHSMGANAALRYGATRTIDGIVALAPGHSPEFLIKQLSADLVRARQMVAAGKGDERASFRDINVGRDFTVTTTAAIYLSWMDPEGSAVMPRNAALFKAPVPVLMVVGSKDPVARSQDYIFGKLPTHSKSRFVTLDADHKEVPDAAAKLVAEWLGAL